jgi:2-dehydro-3-deoxyphosphooctonate aldolase (KDO 8-P synthase)
MTIEQRIIEVGQVKIGNNLPFALMAGPCQIESMDHALYMAEALVKITDRLDIGFIYKSSYDKANRSSLKGARGLGLEKSLKVFENIKQKFGCPIQTDVHTSEQCSIVAEYVDVLQIPAFLCRQTDLLEAAAKTGKAVGVKKGQFLAPWDVKNIINKFDEFGNRNLLIIERGVSFGYNTLVNDMRGLEIMADMGVPVVFDATHSVQQPGGKGDSTGGERRFVSTLAKAAVAVGVAAVFIETHQDPDNAPSDGPNMVKLSDLENLLKQLQQFDQLAKKIRNNG